MSDGARFVRRWQALRQILAEAGISGIAWELFKRRHGLDLAYVSTQRLGLADGQGHHYSDSGGPHLYRVLASLPITRDDAILDLGCGKGGALITMHRFRFGRVAGLDLSPELLAVARVNLDRLQLTARTTLYHADAAEFTNLDPYTHLYFYNPFPEPVIERHLDHLQQSLARRPRRLTLIYKNPVCDPAFRRAFPAAEVTTLSFRGGDHHRIRVYVVTGAATQETGGLVR